MAKNETADETNTRLEGYKTLVELLKYEGEMLWTRTQVFLTINGAVLALLSWIWTFNVWASKLITLGLSIISVLLNWIWILTLRRAAIYSNYWNLQVRSLEGQLPPLSIYRTLDKLRQGEEISLEIRKIGNTKETDIVSVRWSKRARVHKLLEIVAWLFVVGWTLAGIVSLYILIFRTDHIRLS